MCQLLSHCREYTETVQNVLFLIFSPTISAPVNASCLPQLLLWWLHSDDFLFLSLLLSKNFTVRKSCLCIVFVFIYSIAHLHQQLFTDSHSILWATMNYSMVVIQIVPNLTIGCPFKLICYVLTTYSHIFLKIDFRF